MFNLKKIRINELWNDVIFFFPKRKLQLHFPYALIKLILIDLEVLKMWKNIIRLSILIVRVVMPYYLLFCVLYGIQQFKKTNTLSINDKKNEKSLTSKIKNSTKTVYTWLLEMATFCYNQSWYRWSGIVRLIPSRCRSPTPMHMPCQGRHDFDPTRAHRPFAFRSPFLYYLPLLIKIRFFTFPPN